MSFWQWFALGLAGLLVLAAIGYAVLVRYTSSTITEWDDTEA